MNLDAITTIKSEKVSNSLKSIFAYALSIFNQKSIVWSMPTYISVEVSSICNLRCPECPCGNHQIKREQSLMSDLLFDSILDQVGQTLHTIQFFFQGEPLLHPNLIDFIQKANQKNIYTITSTNAQLIDSKSAEAIVKSGLRHIIISIDGTTQESYERYRVGGSLKKALQTIDHLNHFKATFNSKYPKIELQMVVFSHNEHEIEDFKSLGKQYKANYITLKTAQIYDYSNKPLLIPKNKKYTRYIKVNGKWQLKKKQHNHCFRLWTGAVITTSGEVLPCCFDKLAQHPFGSLQNQTFKDIWFGEKAQTFRQQLLRNRLSIEICQNCSE